MDFWKTERGKIINLGVHDHYHATSKISRNIHLIKEKFDTLTKEEIFKRLDNILEGKTEAVKSIDYIYENIKKLENE